MNRSNSVHRCTLCGGRPKYRLATVGPQGLFRCRDCRVLYTSPPPTHDEVEHTYAEDYITDRNALTSDFGDRRSDALDLAAEAIQARSTGGTILDVGCAGGAFLNRFPPENWVRVGVEPSAVAVEGAEPGVEIFRGTFPAAVPIDRRFDVITMMDVIMLIPDPDAALHAAHEQLESRGLLAVEIPGNVFRLLTHVGPMPLLRKRRWCDLNLQLHLFCFPHSVFVDRLERAGFIVEEVALLAASQVGSGLQNRALRGVTRMLRRFPITADGRLSLGAKYVYLARRLP